MSQHTLTMSGDIVILKGHGDPVMALVLDCNEHIASVAVAETDPEWATDTTVVYRAGTVCPWPVVVHLDIVGPVALTSVSQIVGHVFAVPDLDCPGDGLPLRGPADPRWQHAEALAATLAPLLI